MKKLSPDLIRRQRLVSIKIIYEKLFKISLYKIGELWEYNKISVATEHLASAIVESILNENYLQIISEEFTKCDTDNVVISGGVVLPASLTGGGNLKVCIQELGNDTKDDNEEKLTFIQSIIYRAFLSWLSLTGFLIISGIFI